VDEVLGEGVLEDGHLGALAGQLGGAGEVGAGRDQQGDGLAVVGDGELDLEGAGRGDGHELADDVDLARGEVRDAGVGGLDHELEVLGHLLGIGHLLLGEAEEAAGEVLGHVDVEADQRAVLVLVVPRRVGAAGAHDQLAAVEDLLQLAAGGLLRHDARRRPGHPGRGPRHAERRAALQQRAPVPEPGPAHRWSPRTIVVPAPALPARPGLGGPTW